MGYILHNIDYSLESVKYFLFKENDETLERIVLKGINKKGKTQLLKNILKLDFIPQQEKEEWLKENDKDLILKKAILFVRDVALKKKRRDFSKQEI